jgi:hypothetical protein
MRNLILLLAALLGACGGTHDQQPGGDSAGERIFRGAAHLGFAGTAAPCTIIVPRASALDTARARCVTPSGAVTLTGSFTPDPSERVHGTVSLSGTDASGTWSASAIIANTPSGGQPFGGTHELGGEIGVSDGGVSRGGGRIETLEATDNPGVERYCGTVTEQLAGGAPETDAFFLVADARYVAASGLGFWTLGPRLGASATFGFQAASTAGGGTIDGDMATGSYAVGPNQWPFTATRCGSDDPSVCCGSGAATRCCFQTACPCP